MHLTHLSKIHSVGLERNTNCKHRFVCLQENHRAPLTSQFTSTTRTMTRKPSCAMPIKCFAFENEENILLVCFSLVEIVS